MKCSMCKQDRCLCDVDCAKIDNQVSWHFLYDSHVRAHYEAPCECEDFQCPWCWTIEGIVHELVKDRMAHPRISWEDQKAALPEVLPIDLEFHADYFAGRCCVQLKDGDHDV